LFVHGSPRDPVMEYVLKSDGFQEPEKMRQIFALVDRPCFVGHTHWPGVHGADHRFTYASDDHRTFPLDGPCIVNVGSVGQPRDGDWRAAYCIYDTVKNEVELRRLPYDLRGAQQAILAAGLPEKLAGRLSIGR
jgi:diadenosine tetraphosphatase ApaH/serine/threonine PP2A family protein phosphatase